MPTNTKYRRFAKSIQDWLASNSDLTTKLSYNQTTNPNILVINKAGDISEMRPLVLIELSFNSPWLVDIDNIYSSNVNIFCVSKSQVECLEILGIIEEHLRTNDSDQKDASFELNSIKSRGVSIMEIREPGSIEDDYGITSHRRTERSDSPVPDMYVSWVKVNIRWMDKATS